MGRIINNKNKTFKKKLLYIGGMIMGNIRTTFVKRTAKELLEEHGDKFNNDFENNKQVVAEYSTVSTKHLRNQIAGYATHLMDQ